jgi:hypothetical protein
MEGVPNRHESHIKGLNIRNELVPLPFAHSRAVYPIAFAQGEIGTAFDGAGIITRSKILLWRDQPGNRDSTRLTNCQRERPTLI